MPVAVQPGARLILPLRRLESVISPAASPAASPAVESPPEPAEVLAAEPEIEARPTEARPNEARPNEARPIVSRLLHLDARPDSGLARWVDQVRGSDEACLAVDAAGRVVAMSPSCGALLELQPDGSVGALLLDLVYLVDFTQTGLPLVDAERSTPPLRALRSERLARGLVRLRLPMAGPATFDVVGVPLAAGVGALGFFTRV